jgi:hypothetical protein
MSNGFCCFFEAIKEILNELRGSVLDQVANKLIWGMELSGEGEVGLYSVCGAKVKIPL